MHQTPDDTVKSRLWARGGVAAQRITAAEPADSSPVCLLLHSPVQPLSLSPSLPLCPAPGILLAVTTIYQYFEMFVKENGQDNALASFF